MTINVVNSKLRSHLNRLGSTAIRGDLPPSKLRNGAVAVELAIVAPVLMAMTMGMVELTAIFDAQNLLNGLLVSTGVTSTTRLPAHLQLVAELGRF